MTNAAFTQTTVPTAEHYDLNAGAVGIRIINRTPHNVNVYSATSPDCFGTCYASGSVARVNEEPRDVEVLACSCDIDYTTCSSTPIDIAFSNPPEFGAINWGGEIPQGSAVLVSMIVAHTWATSADRPDLKVFSPDTAPDSAVRDTNGNILGVRRLIRWSKV